MSHNSLYHATLHIFRSLQLFTHSDVIERDSTRIIKGTLYLERRSFHVPLKTSLRRNGFANTHLARAFTTRSSWLTLVNKEKKCVHKVVPIQCVVNAPLQSLDDDLVPRSGITTWLHQQHQDLGVAV